MRCTEKGHEGIRGRPRRRLMEVVREDMRLGGAGEEHAERLIAVVTPERMLSC